ncbi:phosphoglycolate phosphatase [Ruminococcus sp. YE71]|uniref:HAD hydrolase-like protein n=1 Tax=unclassified Ruminococcus TaxID=2608920 RepID=UPI0008831FF4|nr:MULTISPECIES: HAD hydrolase-like protein [unclassified Ruminococcus]SDA27233.1 phosphoglycolate phosphatase [Ruminococcus sp. YE78]SFW45361.1 phosphoglycolate phosphatase [Ruminococcus sp. YE71]
MSRFDTLLFDLDGTLTDSAAGILNCFRHSLGIMGIECPEDMMQFVGPPLYDSFGKLCGHDAERTAEAVRHYRERYSAVGLFENEVYGGVTEMLDRLKSAGLRMAVATSKPEVFAVRILDKFGLSGYFEVIGGGDLEGKRDRKDKVIEYVLGRLGITDRSGVLMIGDRRQDADGAHALGLPCMYALWGYGSREEAHDAAAEYLAGSPQEAAEMIFSDRQH